MEFRILGALEARAGSRTSDLGGHRQQLVLAVLLDHANEAVPTDRLIDAVWGEAPPATARKTLQVYVSRLRHALGEDAIASRADAYVLEVAPERIDAVRFSRLVACARRQLDDDPAAAAATLREALALWQGAPWGPLGDEPALRGSRQQLEEQRLEAVAARIEADLASGQVSGLAGELQSLVVDHPLREDLHALLLRVLYRQGRQADALATFQALRHVLDEQLGIEPSPDLQRLHERILRQDPTLAPERSAPLQADGEGTPPGSESPDNAPVPDVRNPYKGLRAFGEDDAEDFFGRGNVVAAVLDRLVRERFLVLVGPSGCGKSSVVRAGVLPAVRRGDLRLDGSRWMVATMVPGSHPFEALEAALLHAAADAPASLREQFRGDDLDLLRAALRIRSDDGTRVLLVIDQFEELYLLARDQDERRRFVRNLLEAVEDPHAGLTILATLRADLFDRPLSDPGLGELLATGLVSVPPLTPGQLEAACTQPAARVGVTVEPELAAEFVSDVADQPGALPLFQYALTRTFAARQGPTLTLETSRRVGGLQGALEQRADEVLDHLDPEVQSAARQVFLRLVTLGEGTEDTRRRVRRAELDALDLAEGAVDAVLDRFAQARLLSLDRDAVSGEPTVEVAHEALLHAWPRLRDWIEVTRADLRLQRSVAVAAAEWEAADHDPDYLLTGSRLALVDTWGGGGEVTLTSLETAFLQASRDHRDRLALDEDRRRRHEEDLEQRSRQRLRTLVVVLAGAALLASLLTVLAVRQANEARDARDQTVAANTLLRGRELTSAAVARRQTDPELGLVMLLHAVDLYHQAGQTVPADTVTALHWLLQEARVPYPDQEADPVVLSGPAGPRGVYLDELPDLLARARAQTDRELSAEECRFYLGTTDCSLPPGDVPVDLAWEQPTSLLGPDPTVPALTGTTVRMMAAGAGEFLLLEEFEAFHERTGIRIQLDQELAFELLLPDRVAAGEVDIALLPQPAAVAEMARNRETIALDYLDADALRSATSPQLVALGSVDAAGGWPAPDGTVYGIPSRLDLKNLVWYPVPEFAAAGYEVPTTWQELETLTAAIVADGGTPWCHTDGDPGDPRFGGWSGSDWIENLVLQTEGTRTFDDWVAGDIPFDTEPVRRAFERFDELVLADGRLHRGRSLAAVTPIVLSPTPLFDDPPSCWLARGASFDPGYFPFGAEVGTNVDWFPVPSDGPATAALGSGEYAVAFTDRPEVREVMRELTRTSWGQELAGQGAWYFPANRSFPLDAYADPGARAAAAVLYDALEADGFRFDGSDLMPEDVQFAFYQGMIDYLVDGPDNLDEVLTAIDEVWPRSREDGER